MSSGLNGHCSTWRLFVSNLLIHIFILLFPKVLGVNCPGKDVLETGGLSCSLIKDIVASHNELRQVIAQGLIASQPAASNMRELYWDEELARGAQKWANHCTFAHNPEAERQVSRFERVGQNIAMSKSRAHRPPTKKEFRKQIQNWFNEHLSFNFGPVNSDDLHTTGHYTQLIWAKTYLVGCGYSRYRANNMTYRLYVCHYGPGGNDFDDEPYQTGDLACPNNLESSKKYRNLCRMNEPPEFNCDDEKKAEGGEETSPRIFGPIEGRRFFLDTYDEKQDISEDRYDHVNEIEAVSSRDLSAVNHIRIEKMYNLVFLNLWRSRD